MAEYLVEFAETCVAVRYQPGRVSDFLELLFADLRARAALPVVEVLDISDPDPEGRCTIANAGGAPVFQGPLGIECAAVLYDQVITHLLWEKNHGVALHAAAVARQGGAILLPGKSGSGKSSVAAWLTAGGFSYLTDELIFLPDDGSGRAIPFPRPLCLKAGTAELITAMLPEPAQDQVLRDELGAVVPHRLLNPAFTPASPAPSLLLFPTYRHGASFHAEPISGARAAAMLMACDVNARNLPDHGFRQLTALARSIPAWHMTYGGFAGLDAVLPLLGQG